MMWSKGIFLFRASLMILLVLGLLPQPSSEAMLSVNAQTIGLMSESTTWRQLFPETLPDPRDLTAFSYDTSRNVFVLFSGRKEVYTWYDDTWEWDGNNWNRKYSSISPSPRSSHGMTFDRQKNTSVMFGGFDGGWPTETWEWNGVTVVLL